jgi:NADH-quinone oxidoreductase subunit J
MTGLWILAQATSDAGEGGATYSRWNEIVRHPITWAVVLGAVAMWLMLPRGRAKGRSIGAVLGVASLGCLASCLLPLGYWGDNVLFWILAGITLVAAVCTVTFRSPVYCAVWFALALVGTAGIFMVQGAQFLGVATIVVYAGAILVTFLFVLMLAQPGGDAYYDRVSWEALLAAATGAVLVGVLSMTVGKLSLDKVTGPTAATLEKEILAKEHVAKLGTELFGRHLVAVEVAGTLLLVALIGATAIVGAQRNRLATNRQEGAR